jgi:DNA polymerase III epsilon subunit-like protein
MSYSKIKNLEDIIDKKVLFIDLETTGIPTGRKIDKPENQYPDFTDTSKYKNSRIVSIGWLYMKKYDYDYNIGLENIAESIIKPEGFQIPEESIKIHGITNEIAQNEGKKIYKGLKKLGNKILKCDYIIRYNIYFDISILLHELHLKDMKKIIEKIKKMKDEEKIICMGIISANEAKPTGWKKFREYQIPKQTEV